MDLKQLRDKYNRIAEEYNDLVAGDDLTAGQERRAADLSAAMAKVSAQIAEAREQAVAGLHADARRRGARPVSGDGAESGAVHRDRSRDDRVSAHVDELDRGRRTIDEAHRSGLLADHAAERAASLLEEGRPSSQSLAARWAVAAGAAAYRTAFLKRLADPQMGHILWTNEERDAYRAAAEVHAELEGRAAMGVGSAGIGAAMVPLTLDPAIMLTNDGSNNPLRQLATVKTTTTNTWQGVTSAGASAEWKAENTEAADGAPTLAEAEIPVFLGDVFVPFSYEIGMDGENFLAELTEVMADAADNLMATAYTTGNGTTAPQGYVTGLAGTASEINTQGSEAIAATDPFDLQNALPARFSANATWQAHIATMNTYRQFETSNGAHEFPELRDNPPYLLGKRFYENSNMDSTINPAATGNNYVLLYGDVAKTFYIVDRIGTSLELIPNMFGTTNGRPLAQRGAFLYFRSGSKVVVPQASRLLDVPTTA